MPSSSGTVSSISSGLPAASTLRSAARTASACSGGNRSASVLPSSAPRSAPSNRSRCRLTSRKRPSRSLTKMLAALLSITDNSAASIFVKDLEGRFLLVNRHLERLLGAERGALLGKTDADLFPPEQAEAVRAADRNVLAAGKPLEIEETVPLEDGMHTYLSIKAPLADST